MKKYRSSVGQRIYPVEYSSMTGNTVPHIFNSFISLVKDTSLAASVTVTEMFMSAQRIAARTYEPFWLYCEVAVIYLIFCTVLTAVQNRGEKWLSRYA